MLNREEWLPLARKLDWDYSYVREEEVFPEVISGRPWLPHSEWKDWEESFKTSYREYVDNQYEKDMAVYAVRDAVGRIENVQKLAAPWMNSLKVHAAALPLAEFTGVIGNLRGARFGRDSAWRTMATFGALDEYRHTQIPLLLFHELVKFDSQFDWAHKFYHTNNWFAIAARHFFDELTVGQNAIEFHIATNFVLETGFTNLQFVGLASLARESSDHMFERMVTSIQTDEARHAQIGHPVLANRDEARSRVRAVPGRQVVLAELAPVLDFDGILDRLSDRIGSTPLFIQRVHGGVDHRSVSAHLGRVRTPEAVVLGYCHGRTRHLPSHDLRERLQLSGDVMVQFVIPGPAERKWLRQKYPKYWDEMDAVWEQISERWRTVGPGAANEFAVHGTVLPTFCDLCQLPLSAGTPRKNSARVLVHEGRKYIFCSEPCQWIFLQEPERYANHKDRREARALRRSSISASQFVNRVFQAHP